MKKKAKYRDYHMTDAEVRKYIIDFVEEEYPHDTPNIMMLDGFCHAFVGIVSGKDVVPKACYDYKKCIDDLIGENNWDEEEALEYFNFNIIDAYVGEHTPVFINKFDGFIG